jgi:hypothetical protein
MKLFKNIDEKFAEIGFKKLEDNKYIVSYERKDIVYNYTQRLDIVHKKSGRHIIQSYDPDSSVFKNVGNTCVGITSYEAKLCIKKMQQKGWKEIKLVRWKSPWRLIWKWKLNEK